MAFFYEKAMVTVVKVSASNLLDQTIQFERYGR